MIRLNVFAGAYIKTPAAQDDLSWGELCDELEAMTAIEAPAKTALLAFTLGTLREAYNVNANYENHTALAIDVDTCPPEALDTIAESGLSAFVYASPSDPNPDGSRRVRIVVPLSRPLPPEHVKHARRAFAELIGIGPGQGVETAEAISQVMFVGQLEGTPAREVWRHAGATLDTDEIIASPLAFAWKVDREHIDTAAIDRVAVVDPDERASALLEALAPHWEAPGEAQGRRQILRALGGYLAKRGWDDARIIAVARGLETERPERVRVQLMLDAARQARINPEGTAGWGALTSWAPTAAAVIEAHAKHESEPEAWEGVFTPWWQCVVERRARRTAPLPVHTEPEAPPADADVFAPAADDDENAVPLFLRARNNKITLMWEGDERGHRPIADHMVRTRIAELGYDQSLVSLRDGSRDVPTEKILEAYGASYENTAYSFSARVTVYDPRGEGHVTIGYPHSGIMPAFDADADAWLRALAGEHYERLAVWIASCSQANIDRLAACVILLGNADVGKSMFGHAVAHTWGQTPAPMSLVVERFNSDMLRTPILVDEEAQLFGSKALSSKRFRDIAQQPTRSIELKGKERVQQIGCQRFVVNCNGMSDLRFSDLGGPAVIGALRDRMLVIDCTTRREACAAALARLRLPGAWLVDLDRVASHMAWLAETVDLPVERFVGAGGDNADGAILAGHTDESVDVWQTFVEWLDSPGAGSENLWRVHGGVLCADPGALALALEDVGRGWDLRAVRAALAPFHEGNVRPNTGERPRLWIVDALRVASSLALDVEALDVLESRLSSSDRNTHDPRGARRFGKFSR